MSETASIDLYERTGFDGGRFISEAIGCTELDSSMKPSFRVYVLTVDTLRRPLQKQVVVGVSC